MSPPRRRRRRDLQPAATSLGRYRRTGAPGGETAQIQRVWAEIVGVDAARHSAVVRRSRAGVVSIACASAPWAQEFDLHRDRWTTELNRRLDDISIVAIRFVVGDHVMPQPLSARPEPVTPTRQDLEDAAVHTPQIADARLRELLIRAQAGQRAVRRTRKRLQRAKK